MVPTLTAKARSIIYWTSWIIGLIAGSAQVATAALGDVPTWLLIGVGVLLFAQSQVNGLAGLNVSNIAAEQTSTGAVVAGPAAELVPEGDPAEVVPVDDDTDQDH